tara:strand:+ start:336 stop:1121 length:786 start_codon:yes stop_codon:yes gene_type:complete
MKTPYLYFGRKGYMVRAGIVNGDYSTTEINLANSGMKPVALNNSTANAALELTHRAVDAQTSKRSALVIAAGPRKGTPAFTGGNAFANIVAGEVSILDNASSYVIATDEELSIAVVGTNGGLTPTTNDFVYLEEVKFSSTVIPFNTLQSDMCLPASGFLGAEPLAYTSGGGLHWDSAKLDATRLSFKSGDGSPTIDKVDLVHTAGKFKEICEAMEDLMNSSVYDKAIVVHTLTDQGQFIHNAFSSRGIKIFRCTLTSGGRS